MPRPEKAGRRRGSPNMLTRNVRRVIETAADRIGGVDRLVAWIMESPENEKIFWSVMYLKLLPLKLMGSGENGEFELDVNVKLSHEEMARELQARGLPLHIFGADTPLLPEAGPPRLIVDNAEMLIAANED